MKKYKDMTSEEIAEEIALAMGWGKEGRHWWDGKTYPYLTPHTPEREDDEKEWNPRHCLNQCAVFEDWLIKNNKWDDYSVGLIELCVRSSGKAKTQHAICATASQRCETFIATMRETT